MTTFSSFADAYEARWRVVRMHLEGWNKKSIADCLKLSRSHVYNILDADGYRTPVDVLGWLRGRRVEAKRLRQLFGRAEFLRTVNRHGLVSVQRFYIYAESGLSRKRVLIWIYEGELSIEYKKTLVARYRCDYDLQHKQLQGLSDPTLYTTAFTPPQLELIELNDEQWVKFQKRPSRTYSKRIAMLPKQLPLIDIGASAPILLALKAI